MATWRTRDFFQKLVANQTRVSITMVGNSSKELYTINGFDELGLFVAKQDGGAIWLNLENVSKIEESPNFDAVSGDDESAYDDSTCPDYDFF